MRSQKKSGQEQKSIQSFFGRPKRDNSSKASSKPPAPPNISTASATASFPSVQKENREHEQPAKRASSAVVAGSRPAWWGSSAASANSSLKSDPVQLASKRMSSGSFGSTFGQSASKKSKLWPDLDKPSRRPSGFASRSAASNGGSVVEALLSGEQKEVLKAVVEDGQSLFFTGAAGTGKSHLLRQIVAGLNRKYGFSEVAVTATTGLAAFNVGGQTVHRWGGLGVGTSTAAAIAQNITSKNKEAREKWKRCKVLVIDEISMLSSDLFDKLEEIARRVRKDERSFGGIQVVCCGDFFQLPPVSASGNVKLCFEAKQWEKVLSRSVVLTKVFRQTDTRLITMLNAMRHGKLSDHITAQFKALARPVVYDDGLEPTRLFARRDEVDRANTQRMAALPGATFEFKASDSPAWESMSKQFEQLLAPAELKLKVGAQVMLIWNINDKLVNGRRGHVVAFVNLDKWPLLMPLFQSDPQVLSLYNELVETGGAMNSDIEAKLNALPSLSSSQRDLILRASQTPRTSMLPLVDFRQGIIVPVEHRQFQVSGGNRNGDGVRTQLPLVLSWALSIHKSQGQTLDRLVVDLSRIFEKGQAYVAVSRATSYDRLEVIGFKPDCVRVDHRVLAFYKQLEKVDS